MQPINRWYLVLTTWAFAALVYLPYIARPILRPTGDEKVYIAQAVEMAARGSWFVQTLADEPSYYKGPLFYQLVRVGLLVFGEQSMWSAIWMNFAGLILVSGWLVLVVFRLTSKSGIALVAGLTFSGSIGLFAHMFAAQMEALLVVCYLGVLLSCVEWMQSDRDRWWPYVLWFLVAMAGCLKSPLHSILIAAGVILSTIWDRQWRHAIFGAKSIGAALMMAVAGALYWSIPYFLDPDAFVTTYIHRETLAKSANGIGPWQALAPVLTIYHFPFQFLFWFGTFATFALWKSRLSLFERRVTKVSLSLALPTLAFFALHPFRSEIYVLPTLPLFQVVAFIGLAHGYNLWPRASAVLTRLGVTLAAVVPILIILISKIFSPEPTWWPHWMIGLSIGLVALSLGIWLVPRTGQILPKIAGLALVPWFFVLGGAMDGLGQRDLMDLNRILADQEPRGTPIGYYNLHHHTWSEWAALGLWCSTPIVGLHRENELQHWLSKGRQVIIPGDQYLKQVVASTKAPLQILEWQRWRTHGSMHSRGSVWATIFKGDIQAWQQPYYVVRIDAKQISRSH